MQISVLVAAGKNMPMKTSTRLAAALPTAFSAAFFAPVSHAQNDLIVGSSSSGVTNDFTSGTNVYDITFVGFGAGANASTLMV